MSFFDMSCHLLEASAFHVVADDPVKEAYFGGKSAADELQTMLQFFDFKILLVKS